MTEERTENVLNKLSRREFLTGAGAFAAGVAIGSIFDRGALSLFPKAEASEAAKVPQWPWPYKKLDPDVVAQTAYEGYFEGACCYGAFKGIVAELARQVGYPYTIFPMDMFKYGEGGVVGWSTLCGALNGASAAINLVSTPEVYRKLINELMGWYTVESLPKFVPANPKKANIEITSVSGSPLCHVSVTNWCKESGFAATSPERAERCGRLCADVAAYAVELLNKHVDGAFVASYTAPASISGCMSCHGTNGMNNTRGLMDCVQCHEPHN